MGGRKRNRLAQLREEHRAIIRQLNLVRSSIKQGSRFSTEGLRELVDGLGKQMETHFKHEQETLYDPLRSALGKDNPAGSMLEGHKAMKRAYNHLLSLLDDYVVRGSSHAKDSLLSGIDSLLETILEYVRKEEKVIFWIAELNLQS
jgi:hemerythrin-like domain-containing protein